MGPAARTLAAIALVAALAIPVSANAGTPSVIRTGGPSAPSDPKAAVVGTDRDLAGKRYVVIDASGATVGTGSLHGGGRNPEAVGARVHRAPHRRRFAGPLPGARTGARPDLTVVDRFDRRARAMRSPRSSSSSPGTPTGARSPYHGPSHLHDATVKGGPFDGRRFDLTGGWMDAGDMIHFAQTTSYAAAVLEAAARIDPAQRQRLDSTAAVGIRWLRKAHPRPNLFIAQVGRPARPQSRLPRSGQGRRLGHPRHRLPQGLSRNPLGWRRRRHRGQGRSGAGARLRPDPRRDGPDPGQAVVRGRQGGGPPEPQAARRLLPRPTLEGLDGRRRRRALPGNRRALVPERCTRVPPLVTERGRRDPRRRRLVRQLRRRRHLRGPGRPTARECRRPAVRMQTPAPVRRDRRPTGSRQRVRDAGLLDLGHDRPERGERRARQPRSV